MARTITSTPDVRREYRRFHFGRAVGFLLIGLGSSACCALGGCPPPSQYPNARAAIDAVRHSHACSRGLRGEAKLDYLDPEHRVRVDAFYMSTHPQQLRFDLVSPFGTPLSTLTVDSTSFKLLDREARAFYTGTPNACNVEQFLRVPVPPEVLVQLLAGEPPVLQHAPGEAHLEWGSGGYVVEIHGLNDATQRLVFEPEANDWDKPYAEQRIRLTEVEVSQKGVLLYRASLRDYFAVRTAAPRVDPDGLEADIAPSGPPCDAEIPRRIRFEIPLAERDVLLEQKNAEHNPPLLPNSFSQERAPGTHLEVSACH